MWSDRLYIWSVFDGTLLSLARQPMTGLLQYSAVELPRLRFHLPEPPPTALHLHPDIAFLPRRRYIHQESRRSFRVDSSKPIKSIWSNSRRSPPNTGRAVNHSVVASLARAANTTVSLAPPYLSDLLHVATPSRTLRSSSSIHLTVPPARLTTMGSRAFSRSAPRLWNSLPSEFRNTTSPPHFKSKLKTYLFKLAFSL